MTALVIVTGGSAGIGRALLERAPDGAVRVDVSRSGCDLAGVEHVPADLADPSAWEPVGAMLRDRISAHEGARVTVVLNAGVIEPIGPAGRVDAAAYQRSVLLNGAAPQVLGHHVLAALHDHPGDRRELVLISSGAARTAYPGWSAYGAAKAATDQWVRTVDAEQALTERPVRVLAVAPGVVATDMQVAIRGAEPGDFPPVERFRDLHRSGQLADPLDVATRLWARLDDAPADPVTDLRGA
ncbi:MAG: SDR family NAD(P)-dependent oxidoreductase [Nitriliruptor sp.]